MASLVCHRGDLLIYSAKCVIRMVKNLKHLLIQRAVFSGRIEHADRVDKFIHFVKALQFAHTHARAYCRTDGRRLFQMVEGLYPDAKNIREKDVYKRQQNSLPPGKICPAGGTVSLKKDGDTWTVSCSIHQNGNTAKSTVEIVNDHVQDLMDKAFADYFKDRPSSKELDSTGTNFGTAIRRDLAELLNIPQDQADQYDFRVYRQTVNGKNEYYVYVFDSLGNHSSGDRIAATRYVFRSGADGSPVLDDSATATGTGQMCIRDRRVV